MSAESQVEIVEPAELDLVEANPATLYRTSDPSVALERMSVLARTLVDVVRSQKLSVRIRGAEYLRVEAWRALGGMIGVHPVTVWSRPNETNDGFLVRVEARTRAGEVVGASEAECSRAESLWADRDPHALRAMAETRATSRALRGPLGQVVVLAGYQATGAEEMPDDDPPPAASKAAPVEPSREQISELRDLIDRLTELDTETDWVNRCREITGVPGDMLTRTGAVVLIEKLRDELARLDDEAAP
jgi:hypothetical protein